VRTHRDKPWDAPAINAALCGVVRRTGCASLLAPAFAIAVPAHVAAEVAVRYGEDSLTYRAREFPYPLPNTQAVAHFVHEVIRVTTRPGDLFTDPSANPASWAHAVRSGSRRVLYGVRELFALPLIAFDPDLDDCVAYAYVRARLATHTPEEMPYVRVGAHLAHVQESSTQVLLHAPSTQGAPTRDLDPLEVGRQLREEIGGELLESPLHENDNYLIGVQGYRISVPAAFSGGGVALGYYGDVEVARTLPDPPSGWTLLGAAPHHHGWVALHHDTRIHALVRQVA
jgi:hypothetical protein